MKINFVDVALDGVVVDKVVVVFAEPEKKKARFANKNVSVTGILLISVH